MIKTLQLDPNSFDSLFNKGVTLSELGKHTEAIPYFDQAISINSKEALLFYYKGLSLKKLGKKPRCLILF